MPVDLLIEHCAPVLAGIKTANLFGYECTKEDAISDLKQMNHLFCVKGLRAIPVNYSRNRALIYVYRPASLSRDLAGCDAVRILEECGYPDACPDMKIKFLITRFKTCGSFPHEIGLFLGYPPEDVEGFIKNKGAHCKYSGYWKVYGDEIKARECFQKYDKCRNVYMNCFKRGTSLAKLTVSTARI